MKKLQLLGLLLSPILFVACDKDDNKKDADLDQIQSRTYTGLNVLDLEYNDSGLAGKSVDVSPASGRDVNMSFYSKVNLGTLNAAFKDLPELDATATTGISTTPARPTSSPTAWRATSTTTSSRESSRMCV